jgi:PAS domain S-box-containing protein
MSIGDAVIGTGEAGQIVFMNAVAQELTGWSEREAKGKQLSQIVTIIDQATRTPVEDDAYRAVPTAGPQPYRSGTLLLRGNEERSIDYSISSIEDSRGTTHGSVLVFCEVSKHPAEAASRDALASIVEHSDDAIIGQDLEGKIISWNAGAERIFGYPAKEMLGQRLSRLLPPDRQHEEAELLGRIRRGEKVDHFHAKSLTRDGRMIDVSVTVSRTRNSRGEVAGTSIIARDITEQKTSEEALKAADYNKDQFLAMLSHELRNPLAPISTALELMGLTGPMNSDQEEAREIIRRQLGRLTRLVDDLVDASRVSRGAVNFRSEALELCALLGEAIKAVQSAVQSHRHRLTTVLTKEPLRVRGDEVRLMQVFTTLLNNAARYTPDGGHISVQLERDADRAVVRIKDSGSGLDPQLLNRVHDAGEAGSAGAHAENGLGIELALMRRIVLLHGGEVRAVSEGGPGGRSEFVVRLPLVKDAAGADASASETQREVSPLKVLIVDDNEDAASSLGMLLQLEGHQTRIEHDGGHALAATAEWTPNVVLLDIGLPDMNGYEVGEKMRANHYSGTLIALTGYGQEADREKSSNAGFDAHLVKPVEVETLKRAIAGHTGR